MEINRRNLLIGTTSSALVAGAGCLGNNGDNNDRANGDEDSDEGDQIPVCETESLETLDEAMPDDGEDGFDITKESEEMWDIGTDEQLARVYQGPDGVPHAYVVAKYTSQSEAISHKNDLFSKATTTMGIVVADEYLLAVDSEQRKAVEQLLQLSPVLNSECVSNALLIEGEYSVDETDCSVDSLESLEEATPEFELGSNFSRSEEGPPIQGIGTDEQFAGVYRGDGVYHAFLIAKYNSESEAEEEMDAVFSKATTTMGIVAADEYLFAVDSEHRGAVGYLLRESPVLTDDCVTNQIIFDE